MYATIQQLTELTALTLLVNYNDRNEVSLTHLVKLKRLVDPWGDPSGYPAQLTQLMISTRDTDNVVLYEQL